MAWWRPTGADPLLRRVGIAAAGLVAGIASAALLSALAPDAARAGGVAPACQSLRGG